MPPLPSNTTKLLRPKLGLFRRTQWRLPHKLLLFYMPLIILPIIFSVQFMTSSFITHSKNETTLKTQQMLYLLVERLDLQFERFEELSLKIFMDTEVRRILKSNPQGYLEDVRNRLELEDQINRLLEGIERPYVISSIFETDNTEYITGQLAGQTYWQDEMEAEYIRLIEEGKGKTVWNYSESTPQFPRPDHYRLGRMLNEIIGSNFNVIGRLVMLIQKDIFVELIQDAHLGEDTRFIMTSEEGQTIISLGDFDQQRDTMKNIVIPVKSAKYGWTLEADIPLVSLYETINRINVISFILTATCLIIGLILTHLLAVDIVFPVRKLMLNIKHGMMGFPIQKLNHFYGAREITELNEAFISSFAEIRNLNDQVLISQQKKQAAEVRTLQNQLTPHFLYNSLNSIRWMAMLQKQDNIKETVDALSKLLTYSLRDFGKSVALQQELDILNEYIFIQKVRFRDIEFITNIPPPLDHAQILKFMIQPIVENALIHGLSGEIDGGGRIVVSARIENKDLIIVVYNNGKRMDDDELERIVGLLEGTYDSDRWGLRSIQERVRLYYGESYGLSFHSPSEGGFQVEVKFPYISVGGENVENRDDR